MAIPAAAATEPNILFQGGEGWGGGVVWSERDGDGAAGEGEVGGGSGEIAWLGGCVSG